MLLPGSMAQMEGTFISGINDWSWVAALFSGAPSSLPRTRLTAASQPPQVMPTLSVVCTEPVGQRSGDLD